MALSQTGNVESDSVGAEETIGLQAQTAVISSAFYGTDTAGNPAPATVADDGKSVTITVKSGLNTLTVNLIAEDPAEPPALLFQGMTPLLLVSFEDNGGVGAIPIVGN
jgi:hypothetical protein